MTYKGLPVYNINIEAQDEEFLGLTCVSIVSEPAVCEELYCFDKAEKKQMIFTSDNNEQHCITSVALLSDTPIYRVDQYGNGYYVVFEKQTIRDLVEKYSKDGYNNITSFQHDGQEIDDFVMLESYFVDKENGVVNNRFDVPDGSWIVTYKCTNEETWNKVKNELSTGGYSVEIICDITPAKDGQYIEEEPEPNDYQINTEAEDWLMELLAWLEDEDVEVLMKGDKKKDEFKRTTSGDIKAVMDANRKVNITIGKQVLYEQQIFQLGENNNGKLFAVVYDPQTRNWSRIEVHSIDKLEITELELENWDFNAKWKQIVADESIGIIDTAVGHTIGNTFRDAIETNRLVMLTYHDETEDPATGYRTVLVTSLGYTTGSDGSPRNQTIRGYTYSGSSKTGLEENDGWRFYLCRRIKEFKIVDYVDPILQAPPHYNGEAQANSGKLGSMSNVEVVMQFPPIRTL